MRLALRNAIAETVLEALADRARMEVLADLARLLDAGTARVAAASVPRLLATRIVRAPRAARAAAPGGTILALQPSLAAERGTAAARAARALAVAERYWQEGGGGGDPLRTALVQAALFFNAGLFFEVHEVLEAAWGRLAGETRSFVQGLIQIAVALHHLEGGNAAGARTLFAAGRAKLARHAPEHLGVGVAELLAGLVPWEEAAAGGARPSGLTPPVLRIR